MSHKESFNRAVKDDHFDVLVSFNRRDDFVELRNRSGTEDVERRMIKRYSPILGRAPRKMYLLCACCYVRSAFHVFVSNEFSAVVQKRSLRTLAFDLSSPDSLCITWLLTEKIRCTHPI